MTRGAPEVNLVQIAHRVLRENGFDPDMPQGIERSIPRGEPTAGAEDLRDLPWSSIDNHDSKDLDQVEYAEALPDGSIRMRIGIADVDAFVPRGSPIDRYAWSNTLTLYTGVHIFPMLPEELSTDRTSLLEDQDRLAMITEMVIRKDGSLDDTATRIYPARVRNHAKLIYENVGAWLEGNGPAPESKTIAAQLAMHDEVAQRMRRRRYELGALDFETIEARPVTKDGKIVDLVVTHKNRARELVEDLMIAANGATARYLESRGYSSIRRIVRAPKRWDRIVEIAGTLGFKLPELPNAAALSDFLAERRTKDPTRFADLSLTVVKLLGPGEYVLQRSTEPDVGHFGLAVEDYAHSTAPNRRYPDLITQRLLKAAARKDPQPYSDEELLALAAHCTLRENGARKVERTMRKVAAATLLSSRIGDEFDAVVTGASPKGTYARLFRPPAEGRVVRGERGLDVGDKIRVKLVDTEPTRGFIDFITV
ncbi:MAG: RNB domain-containing ribonuclease [Deltaproteobacteria bacterium]|nr:RNB domain-containing ribonuclease [Deltaproteobacteria bacterium]